VRKFDLAPQGDVVKGIGKKSLTLHGIISGKWMTGPKVVLHPDLFPGLDTLDRSLQTGKESVKGRQT